MKLRNKNESFFLKILGEGLFKPSYYSRIANVSPIIISRNNSYKLQNFIPSKNLKFNESKNSEKKTAQFIYKLITWLGIAFIAGFSYQSCKKNWGQKLLKIPYAIFEEFTPDNRSFSDPYQSTISLLLRVPKSSKTLPDALTKVEKFQSNLTITTSQTSFIFHLNNLESASYADSLADDFVNAGFEVFKKY